MRTYKHQRSFLLRTARPSYTLIELLIVVMIAILLMVVSLPVAKSVMENARPREAARILNTTLFTAKARAAGTDRLAGIEFVLQRMNDPGATQGAYQCTQMYMCEVPALYMGDTTDARATVNSSGAITFSSNADASLPTLLDASGQFEIRFNHRGIWYQAQHTSGNYQIQNFAGSPYPPIGTGGSTFQIRRPPVRVGNPVELPRSTAIDMVYSGVGPGGTEFSTANGLRIMFAPAGNLHSLTISVPNSSGSGSTTQHSAAFGTVHFLVGLTNKINLPQDPTTSVWNYHDPQNSNLADGNALWVSVSRNSGVVTTNENAPDPSLVSAPGNSTQRANFFVTCRQYATNREQKGGL